MPADSPVTATEFWYSLTPLIVIGLPSLLEVTDCDVQLPGGPYCTTALTCVLVAQLTWNDELVRSVRYGALVRDGSAPGSAACAIAMPVSDAVTVSAAARTTMVLRRLAQYDMSSP